MVLCLTRGLSQKPSLNGLNVIKNFQGFFASKEGFVLSLKYLHGYSKANLAKRVTVTQ